jgi:hypothetical protein
MVEGYNVHVCEHAHITYSDYAAEINVYHMRFTCLKVHRSPWRVSAIEQESELLGHLNG